MKPSSTAPFHDHFSAVATSYADFRPTYPTELFDYLATMVPRDVVVWDCACGNGQASVGLTSYFAKIVATDASPEQIQAAKAHPQIEFRVAPAERSPLPDCSVDLVTVAQALHWFDLDAFYGEVRRVLRPQGILALWAYGINELEGPANEVVQHFYHNVVGPYWPPQRLIVEQGYRTIPFPFEEIVGPAFRMEATWTLDQLLGYFGTWSATNRLLKATGQDPLPTLRQELMAAGWTDPNTPHRVTWPIALRVGRHQLPSLAH